MSNELSSIREAIRRGEWSKPTSGLAPGYTQANLVILPKRYAYDFLLFCVRNPKPCPLLEVTDTGSPVPVETAPGADLRTDLPKYRIYKHGELIEELNNISDYWSDDFVSFILGCSFTFERPLLQEGIPVRHIEEECNVPMYLTNIACSPAGVFSGPMVVSMRPMKPKDVIRAVQITSRFPSVHGAPVHIGNPRTIGIKDINKPDFGDPVTVYPDEIPVFWACGVTPQAVAMASKPEIMITHAPGHMFITDLKEEHHALL
ncbi:putative hydro-lyase [Microaerobacter geothermalis]|uniref:putative hydro-lyase n=1 Tax=Microaerobacter geothermalis TaxID=674972 RepID=UPI001F36F69B|nr:putative hydro-lyase [Microaerobacter geothermalis]MCF6095062.1 putative hydro-lyase [Microaerobacter geothermalis]